MEPGPGVKGQGQEEVWVEAEEPAEEEWAVIAPEQGRGETAFARTAERR